MNINVEYAEVLAEVDILLQSLDEKLLKRIPEKLKSFIHNNKSESYIPSFDINKKIEKNDLKLDTRVLLAYIYRNYICDKIDRESYDLILKNNEIEYQKKINSENSADNLFLKSKLRQGNLKDKEEKQQQSLVEYKVNFFVNILSKIKSFFIK